MLLHHKYLKTLQYCKDAVLFAATFEKRRVKVYHSCDPTYVVVPNRRENVFELSLFQHIFLPPKLPSVKSSLKTDIRRIFSIIRSSSIIVNDQDLKLGHHRDTLDSLIAGYRNKIEKKYRHCSETLAWEIIFWSLKLPSVKSNLVYNIICIIINMYRTYFDWFYAYCHSEQVFLKLTFRLCEGFIKRAQMCLKCSDADSMTSWRQSALSV